MRATLAVLLALSIPVNAETTVDPLWYLLSTQLLARDEKAVATPDDTGADSQGLASLQADLLLLANGFESFRDEAQVKSALTRLEPRIAPELRPFFASRASSLGTIYRTLAVTDYTWARRFPAPSCAPVEARRRLLSARDGLFQNDKGETSVWLASLLGTGARVMSAEEALDKASARSRLSAAEYENRRARVNKLTLALSSEKAVDSIRSKLYCSRAFLFEELAAFHAQDGEVTLASRSAVHSVPEFSIFMVVWNSQRAAATLVETKGGPVLVTDAAVVEGVEHPNLFAYSDKGDPVQLTATVTRRDVNLGLATMTFSEKIDRPALALASSVPVKDELVYAIGHSQVSGLWTKTSGLVTKTSPDTFQTDAAVSADFTGGPVLSNAGEVTGLLVRRQADTEEGHWPVAVPAPQIARWLDGVPTAATTVPETIEDAGTAAILTSATPAPIETGLDEFRIPPLPPPPPEPPSICVARCGGGSSPSRTNYTDPHTSSGGSTYSNNGSAELGQALGQLGAQMILKGIPALFRGISGLFKNKSRTSLPKPEIVDNRHQTVQAQVAEMPKPPPDPLKPSSMNLTVSRTFLAQGENVEAIATVGFSGKDGSRAGLAVSFTVAPGGIIDCPSGRTDPAGIARVSCRAIFIEGDHQFDGLQDETRRQRGLKPRERARRKPTKVDKIAELKERFGNAQDKLVIEEDKQPLVGTDTPGLDRVPPLGGTDTPGLNHVLPIYEPEEYEVKGDRVTLGASLERYKDQLELAVTDRPCPSGTSIRVNGRTGSNFRCFKPGEPTPGLSPGNSYKSDAGQEETDKIPGETEDGPETEGSKEPTGSDDEDGGYREKTRDKVREKLPRDRQMGGEDSDPWKGKGPEKGSKEYDDQRRELEKEKGKSGIGGAGSLEDAK